MNMLCFPAINPYKKYVKHLIGQEWDTLTLANESARMTHSWPIRSLGDILVGSFAGK